MRNLYKQLSSTAAIVLLMAASFAYAGESANSSDERPGILFIFPYNSGQFRDTFTYDPATSSWTFLLESALPDGSWKRFAQYTVTRD